MSDPIRNFQLQLFSGRSKKGECVFEKSSNSNNWQDYIDLKVPGFSGSVSVSLASAWHTVINEQLDSYSGLVTGYETIVKFGNTHQLKENYTVKISVNYG